jgi:hypothetical protein
MKASRRLLAAIALAGSLIVSPARSASYSTDQSDLWWIPAESGWGIQFVQRSNLIFATMFVYDPSGNPTWYVAVMVANGLTWTGDLYSTRGPWFGNVPFSPAAVQETKAGSMSWSPSKVNAGTLTYTVNGTEVTKELQRQFIAVDDFSGDYGGNLHQVNSGCSDPNQNGTSDLLTALAVRQSGTAVTFATADENLNVCRYEGPLSQAGQMACFTGAFMCTDGTQGSFNFCEIQVNPSGITARFTKHAAAPAGCMTSGWFGGGRGTTF